MYYIKKEKKNKKKKEKKERVGININHLLVDLWVYTYSFIPMVISLSYNFSSIFLKKIFHCHTHTDIYIYIDK